MVKFDDEKHESVYQEFKKEAENKFTLGPTDPSSCSTDTTLRRFFVARSYDKDAAMKQYTEYRDWVKKVDLASISATAPSSEDPLQKLYCYLIKGVDKENFPVYIERMGAAHMPSLRQLVNPTKDFAPYYACKNQALVERCENLSQEHKADIHKAVIICDMSGLGMQHRFGMDYFAVSSGIDEKYFPETVKKVFCINCPWVFPAIFAIAKKFIDKNTVGKIEILSGDGKDRLLEFIAADQLPKEYGGTAEWTVPIPQHEELVATMEKRLDDLEKKLEDDSSLKDIDIAAGKTYVEELKNTEYKGSGGQVHFFFHCTSEVEFSVVQKTEREEDAVVYPADKQVRYHGSFPVDSSQDKVSVALTLTNKQFLWGMNVKFCLWYTDE